MPAEVTSVTAPHSLCCHRTVVFGGAFPPSLEPPQFGGPFLQTGTATSTSPLLACQFPTHH